MRGRNYSHKQTIFGFLIAVMLLAVGCQAVVSKSETAKGTAIVAKCKADLAKRLKLQPKDTEFVSSEAVTWPNAALGMPERDKAYAEMETPGFRVVLDGKGTNYLYTTSKDTVKYGGPVSIWDHSVLYIKDDMTLFSTFADPNLNGELHQCSLTGTNDVKLFPTATDFYPQKNGVVIIKTRTSRSGHDLAYFKVGDTKVKTIYSAFDFGEAAINDTQTEWAGFVRPSLGLIWNVTVAPLGKDSPKAQVLPLPDGVKPGKIAWSDDNVMILVSKADKTACFEIDPKAASPEWKEVSAHTFPGMMDYVLNKSESLEVEQVTKDGKPAVEVARVWFTGDRNAVATITNFKLKEDHLMGGYIFILGEQDGTPTAYTISLATGETFRSFKGEAESIKPFDYAPLTSPLKVKETK